MDLATRCASESRAPSGCTTIEAPTRHIVPNNIVFRIFDTFSPPRRWWPALAAAARRPSPLKRVLRIVRKAPCSSTATPTTRPWPMTRTADRWRVMIRRARRQPSRLLPRAAHADAKKAHATATPAASHAHRLVFKLHHDSPPSAAIGRSSLSFSEVRRPHRSRLTHATNSSRGLDGQGCASMLLVFPVRRLRPCSPTRQRFRCRRLICRH